MCTNGTGWGNVDYSSCTMRENPQALPLIMVELKDLDSSISETSAVNQVSIHNMYNLELDVYSNNVQ